MRRIEAISAATTLGVALGVLPLMAHPLAAALAPLPLSLCFLLLLRGRRELLLPTLFFAGFFLGAASSMLPPAEAGALTWLGERLRDRIDTIPFRDSGTAALLKAFLSGWREELSPEVKAVFRSSGASHLLALSGLHIGILYTILSKAATVTGNSPAGRTIRSVLIVAAALVFTLMTGASPSIVRAFLFILASETAKLTHRSREPLKVLSFALMVQLVITPRVILSVGFQLSYLAMCGIFVLFPIMKDWFPGQKWNPLKKLWDAAALSISCQIFTGPLVWIKFHSFPKHFLITNLLAIPLTTLTLSLGILAVAFPSGWPPKAAEWCANLLLSCLEIISSM